MTSAGELGLAERLRAGDVVLLNTETLPGLHAVASRSESVAELVRHKGSTPGRPFLLLFADLESVLDFATAADAHDVDRLERAWPGPLTALLSPRPSAPSHWVHEGRTIAARVPQADSLRSLIRSVGGPLFSTSANRAGEDPAATLGAARATFPELVADDLGIVPLGMPSTVVDLSVAPGQILRPGAVAWPPEKASSGGLGGLS